MVCTLRCKISIKTLFTHVFKHGQNQLQVQVLPVVQLTTYQRRRELFIFVVCRLLIVVCCRKYRVFLTE
jgi:hypothetical protein